MKKRVIYLLLTLSFILTTICQATMPVFAQQKTANVVSHMSKVINYQKAFESTSSIESALASSNQEQVASASKASGSTKHVANTQSRQTKATVTPRNNNDSTIKMTAPNSATPTAEVTSAFLGKDVLLTVQALDSKTLTESILKLENNVLTFDQTTTDNRNSNVTVVNNNGVIKITPTKGTYLPKVVYLAFKVANLGTIKLQLMSAQYQTSPNSNQISFSGEVDSPNTIKIGYGNVPDVKPEGPVGSHPNIVINPKKVNGNPNTFVNSTLILANGVLGINQEATIELGKHHTDEQGQPDPLIFTFGKDSSGKKTISASFKRAKQAPGETGGYPDNRSIMIVADVLKPGVEDISAFDTDNPQINTTKNAQFTGIAKQQGAKPDPEAIDDSIDGWQTPAAVPTSADSDVKKVLAQTGMLPFEHKNDVGLVYTFGSLGNPEDPTEDPVDAMQTGSLGGVAGTFSGGQINMAIKNNSAAASKMVRILYGTPNSNGYYGNAAQTSLGYGITFNDKYGATNDFRNDLSIMLRSLKDRQYFVAPDPVTGGLAMKVMGQLTRDGHHLLAEILLRPSKDNKTEIQQELYLKNEDQNTDSKFIVQIGHDTMLGTQDDIPIRSMGDNRGMYIEGGQDESGLAAYKILMKMDVPNGPDDFANLNDYTSWYAGWSGKLVTGAGLKNTQKALDENTMLSEVQWVQDPNFPDDPSKTIPKLDTAYVAKWKETTLKPGEQMNYRQDIVGIYGPLVTPEADKQHLNKTKLAQNPDATPEEIAQFKNEVGDTIQYTLHASNSGFMDNWKDVTITDSIPEGVQIKTGTIKATVRDYTKGQAPTDPGVTKTYTAKVDPSAYDKPDLKIKLSELKDENGKAFPGDLGDNDSVEITFDAKILSKAAGTYVENTFDAKGKAESDNSDKDTSASDKYYVEPVTDSTSITKLVRNLKDPQSTFADSANASVGDHVQYQIETTVSPVTPLTGGQLEDQLDPDLTLIPDKVFVQYMNADKTTWNPTLISASFVDNKLTFPQDVPAGTAVRVIFDATVNETNKTEIDNTAKLVAGSYGAGTETDAPAKVKIVDKNAIAKDSMHQYIKNITPKADGTTKDTDDALEETSGVKGDQIQYTFKAKADAQNTKKLLKVAIANITMDAADQMDYVDGSLKINGTKASAAIETAFKSGYSQINAVDELAKDTELTVTYDMTIKNDTAQTITNDGWLTATVLDGSTEIDTNDPTKGKGIKFNQTKLVVSSKHAVKDDIKQTIFNTTMQAISTDGGTKAAGKMDDVIEYKFTATADPDNTSDLINVALKNIAMTTKVGTNPEGPLAAGDMTLVTAPTLSLTVQNGATETLGVVSDFNQGKVNIGDVHQGDTMTVTYLMKVGTNVPQVITNNGDLTADNLTTKAFNATELTIGKQNNTATLEQSIRNKSVTTDDWHAPTTAKQTVETNGKPGDIIGYRFDIVANDANDGDLLNVKIQDIIMHAENQLGFKTGSLKLWINGEPTTAPSAANFPNEVKITDRLAPKVGESKVWARIDYDMTVKADAVQQDVTNDGQASASNLTTSPISANQSILHIKNKRAVKLEQTLKNETTEDTSTSTDPDYPDADGYRKTTKGIKDDIIDYRFKVKADADNSVDITGLNIHNIVMNKAGQLAQIPANNKPYTLNVEILKADGTHYTTDTGAKFNATFDKITLTKPLQPGQTAMVIYKMKVTADITDTTPALDKVVKNDGQLSAANLTDANGVAVAQTAFNQTVLNLENGTSMMTIQYVDLDVLEGQGLWGMPILAKVAEPVQVKGNIGQKLSDVRPGERLAPKVVNASNSTDGGEYTVISFTSQSSKAQDLEHATWSAAYKDDPEFGNEDTVITYGYKKRMIGIEAPKYWDFGNYNRTQSDQTYYLDPKGTPQKVTVTDNYGVHDWSLQVSQPRQFTDDRKQELKDAQLRFQHGNVSQDTVAAGEEDAKNHGKLTLDSVPKFDLTPGSSTATTLMSFAKKGPYQKDDITEDTSNKDNRYDNPGIGVWHYNFGDKKTAGSSIGLHVPATTKRDNTTYQAVLEWSMAVAP